MPVSPRTQQETNLPDGSSNGGKGKSKSKPTTKRRNQRQKVKEKYAKTREDAQLLGLIPTTPEGAIRPERVRASADPALPEIVRKALKDNWATPDQAKPDIIAALLKPFYEQLTVVDPLTGAITRVSPSMKALNELARTIAMLDKDQHERDHPADKARSNLPTTININVETVENKLEVVTVDTGNQQAGTGLPEAAELLRVEGTT